MIKASSPGIIKRYPTQTSQILMTCLALVSLLMGTAVQVWLKHCVSLSFHINQLMTSICVKNPEATLQNQYKANIVKKTKRDPQG